MVDIKTLERACKEIKRDTFGMILNAKSGHLGGCASSAELLTAFYFAPILNYDLKDPKWPDRDRVLIRGHLGPLRYKIFSMLGWIPSDLSRYRMINCGPLEGHESMEKCPGVDITPSGALGMVLSYGVGAAIAAKNKGKNFKVYVFFGDGEEQEGNIGEAARHASSIGLDNLIGIMDCNKKQLTGPTHLVDGKSDVKKIWEGYGWDVLEIKDGHNLEEILDVFGKLGNIKKQTLIIANTVKGNGLEGAEDSLRGYHSFHNSSIEESVVKNAMAKFDSELKQEYSGNLDIRPLLPAIARINAFEDHEKPVSIDMHNPSKMIGTIIDYFNALSQQPQLKNSNFYVISEDITPKRIWNEKIKFIDVGIREQHALAMSHGIYVTDPNSFIMAFFYDPFIYRATDQLWSLTQGKDKTVVIGRDAGLTWGQNGPTHESSGTPGMLLSMSGLTLLEPADPTDTLNCLNYAFCKHPTGPIYIRAHDLTLEPLQVKERTTTYYIANEPSKAPNCVLVSSGFAASAAISAAKQLESEGVYARVINVINQKSLDETFVNLLGGKPVLTIYNGIPEILQSSVAKAAMEYGNKHNTPSKIIGHGFKYGATGRNYEVIKHFKLDSEGITEILQDKLLIDVNK